MTPQERDAKYQAVCADIERLFCQAANDKKSGGMLGLGAVWLASDLFARNEQFYREQGGEHEPADPTTGAAPVATPDAQ